MLFFFFFISIKIIPLYSRILTEAEVIPSAQAISLSESVAARKGLAYSSFNPAAGAEIKNLSILFNHLEWFLDYKVDDIKITIPFYNKFNIMGGGTIYYFLNLNEYNETSIQSLSYHTIATYLSLNKTLIKNSNFLLDAGILTKFINYKLINEDYNKLLFDGGILLSIRLPTLRYSYRTHSYNFSIGAAVQNLLLDKDYKEMPFTIRSGINYLIIPSLTISVDYIYGKQSYLCSGIEYLFKKRIYIRIGYKFLSDVENISFGTGFFYNIRKNHFILNYSFSPSLIGNIHTLSLKWFIRKNYTNARELYYKGISCFIKGEYKKAIYYWKMINKDSKFYSKAKNKINNALYILEKKIYIKKKLDIPEKIYYKTYKYENK